MGSRINALNPRDGDRATPQAETRANFVEAKNELDSVLANLGGAYPSTVLRLASNVAAHETVTIGGEVYEFTADGTLTSAGVAVDVSGGLTPTVASAALVAAFNANTKLKLVALAPTVNEVVFVRKKSTGPDTLPLAVSEALGGTNNAISPATIGGGAVSGAGGKYARLWRVPTAIEVALGFMNFFVDFAPTMVVVTVRTAATAAVVAWDGAVALTAASGEVPDIVRVSNAGNTDWSVNEIVQIEIYG